MIYKKDPGDGPTQNLKKRKIIVRGVTNDIPIVKLVYGKKEARFL